MKLHELLKIVQDTAINISVPIPMICGGVARDKYIGNLNKISDLDLTNGEKNIQYLSEEVANNLRKKYNLTKKNMEDGHSSIYIGNLKLDFSSNFILPNIDPILNNLGMNKPTNMQKEIFSRDFTCNALLLSLDLNTITDPTKNGFKDIKDKKKRTCLKPEITLISNKSRVIRSIYLAAKLDFDIDNSIINFVRKNPESINISTKKNLNDKLNEAFKWDSDKASYFLTKMDLWDKIPINKFIYPFYLKAISKK